MKKKQQSQIRTVPWKLYSVTALECLLAFYLATFSLAMFFKHKGQSWIFYAIILGLLYAFVLFFCAQRIFSRLPIATIFLIIPIAPFIALVIVLSLIPILQFF